jgi:hypothetical protein
MDRRFHLHYNIGRAKYVINYHDGEKTHADGSRFYDMAIYGNKRKQQAKIRELRAAGYIETKGPLYDAR